MSHSKDQRHGVTNSDIMEMRRIWDANDWPRTTHRFKWSHSNDRFELWHQPTNELKAYQDGAVWIEV